MEFKEEEWGCAVCETMCSIKIQGTADFEPEVCPFDGTRRAKFFSLRELEQARDAMMKGIEL